MRGILHDEGRPATDAREGEGRAGRVPGRRDARRHRRGARRAGPRRRHPGRGSRSPPAARPPTSPPGWSPSAAAPGCSARAPTPAPGTLVRGVADRRAGSRCGARRPAAPARWCPWSTGGTRSMASDPGDLSWLDEVAPGTWLEGADWLFVSGYALLRTPDPQRVVETAAVARAHGTRIARRPGLGRDGRGVRRRRGSPTLCAVAAAGGGVRAPTPSGRTSRGSAFGAGGSTVLVLKHGAARRDFVIDGGAPTSAPPSRGRSST